MLEEAIKARQQEIENYQININNYTIMLRDLPEGAWPDDLANQRTADVHNLPAAVPEEVVQMIADYQFRDKLRFLLRSEKIEQGKARRVLAALVEQQKG